MGKGGIIGKSNNPSANSASGMWSLREQYGAIKNSVWPPVRIVTSGLVLYLDAGNNLSYSGSGNNWIDLTGRNNNANVSNVTYTNSNGGTFQFNGTTGLATTGASSDFNFSTNDFTISSWIWIDSTAAPTRPFDSLKTVTIFDCGPSNANSTSFAVGGNTVSVGTSIEFFQSSPSLAVNILRSISANAWHQVVWQRSGLTFNGYLDGTSVGSAAISNVAIGGNNSAFIGQSKLTNPTNFKNEFKGYISSLQIYNRALSAAEILQNFNALRGRFGI